MTKRISYRAFASFMRESGYSEEEIRHLFRKVKTLTKETRRWFIDWFSGGGYPSAVVEGVNVAFLVDDFGLKPVNAFIVIDWLKRAPEEAKYFLLKTSTALRIDDATRAEMAAFAASHGITQTPEAADTTDITE